ncbi:MAG: hypothetical protein ACD_10C00671G0001 [uncultured bacterium]|nr:MAG: hypothetical protein ACD_10C00671G0001 [uncultured bacterium]
MQLIGKQLHQFTLEFRFRALCGFRHDSHHLSRVPCRKLWWLVARSQQQAQADQYRLQTLCQIPHAGILHEIEGCW